MKKNLLYILVVVIIIGLVPSISLGIDNHGDFINVRIDIKNINQEIPLFSPVGFYLYDKDDLSSEILEINEKDISIKINKPNSIDIYDDHDELIDTVSTSSALLIGSRDTMNPTIQVDKNKYRGYISFLVNNESINIINYIKMEEYLYGVVPKEIPASSQHEALKSQAVVARSYAYTNINNHIKDGYNLCNTTHCQVYGGFDGEYPSTNQAVKDTYGEYVSYDGKVINTPYHSNSGGHTEDSDKVWGGSYPYLVGVEDIYSANAPNSSWTMDITPREVQNKFSSIGMDLGEIIDIKIEESTPSKRVLKIRIIGSKKEEVITGERFRSIMGNTYLKSTLFTIDKKGGKDSKKVYSVDSLSNTPKELNLGNIYIVDERGNTSLNKKNTIVATGKGSSINLETNSTSVPTSFVVNGKGYGHGVGMSQYGAMEMAKQGYNYKDIIKHYYKGVEIINLRK